MARKKLDLSKLQTNTSQNKSAEVSAKDNSINERVNVVEINFKVEDTVGAKASELLRSQFNQTTKPKPSRLLLEELLSTEVNLVDGKEADDPNVRQDFISSEYLKFSDKLNLKVPSDKQNILNSPQDCVEILEALSPLARFILGLEFDHTLKFYLGDRLKWYKASDNNISREKILLEIKLKTLYLITKTARIANEFLIKPQFSFEKFKQLVKTTLKEADLVKVTAINLTDLSDILEGTSRIYPEFTFLEKQKKAIEQELFRKGNLQATSSSLVTDACYSFFVGKTLSFSKLTEGFIASKSFGVGSIEIIIREAKEAILNEYGEDTLKIFYSLVGYSMEKGRRFNEVITVSGKDILGYLNKKYERDSKGKRVKKIESLEWLAHHCNLLERIKVFSGGITPNGKGKKSFSILETPLITFDAIEYDCQLDIYGKPDRSKIYDLHITFKPGGWFEKFYNEDNLKNLGYVHKEALASNGIGSKILNWLVFKLEQHQSGDFKIKTILEDIGFKAKLEEILSDYKKKKNKAQNLYRDFNKAIEELKQIEDPYPIEYRNPPEWLLDSSKRKSNGWFKQWLNTVIIFKHPLCLIGEGKSSRREKKINSTPKKEKSKLTVETLKSALASNPNVSIRKLSSWYGQSFSWLQRRLKKDNFTQTEIQDLLNGIKYLSKK